MDHIAAVSLVLGVVLIYSAWRTLRDPWPQYTSRSGGAAYQHLAFAGLLCGVALIACGLVLGVVHEYRVFSQVQQQQACGGGG